MPKVTNCPSRATLWASSIANWNAFTSFITWSDGATTSIASGFCLYSNKAAARIAGAVLRPSGSIKIAPGSMPISYNCSVTINL